MENPVAKKHGEISQGIYYPIFILEFEGLKIGNNSSCRHTIMAVWYFPHEM
jgi:hypothetical protein